MLIDLLEGIDRPLIWLDVETHDFVPPEKSHICEIGFTVFYPKEHGREPLRWESLIKPPVPISKVATEKHHITNEMVAESPAWVDVAANIARGFTNVDFGGYNGRFDLRVIVASMTRVNIPFSTSGARLIDPLRIWQVKKARTLSDAVREFCGREPNDAHRALADAMDAHDVAKAMLERFPDLPRTVQGLHDLCFPVDPSSLDPDKKLVWIGDDAAINFGKHAGTKLKNVPDGYLKWMVNDGDFGPEVKQIARDARAGIFPKKEA